MGLLFNQYIDGVPYLGCAVELSMSGALVRRVLMPDVDRASYALELDSGAPEDARVWLCAAPIWRQGSYEAVRFVAQSLSDRMRLAALLSTVAPS